MLARNSYDHEDVDACRARVDRHIAAWQALAEGCGHTAALADAEPVFFNGLVLELELSFAHRTRGREGADSDPLDEVRVLAGSLTSNDGRLAVDRGVRWMPERTVLGYRPGEQIAVREAEFVALAKAFFVEVEQLYC